MEKSFWKESVSTNSTNALAGLEERKIEPVIYQEPAPTRKESLRERGVLQSLAPSLWPLFP